MTKERAEFRRLAQSTDVGTVTRGQLAILAQGLPCTGLISATESHLLTTIINTARAEAFDRAGRPIVFKSNRQLAFEINRSPGRVSRILSRLFDAGMITMQDSANLKRYPIRDGEGDIADACGIDLRILIARYDELDAHVKQSRQERRVCDAAARRYRAALRGARSAFCFEQGFSSDKLTRFARRIDRISGFVGVAARASADLLRRATAVLDRLVANLLGADRLRCIETDDDMTLADAANDMHSQITTPHSIESCKTKMRSASAEHIRSDLAGFASNWALEKSLRRGCGDSNRPPATGQALVGLNDVYRAAPSLFAYFTSPLRSWSDLARLIPQACRIAGVSEDARLRAVETMGQQAADVAIAITFEKYHRQEVSSPGGYLRAMTKRSATGELYLSRSVFGLAARNSMETSP
ncbi:plasmid replication protein RepC [Rhizobium sp.]